MPSSLRGQHRAIVNEKQTKPYQLAEKHLFFRPFRDGQMQAPLEVGFNEPVRWWTWEGGGITPQMPVFQRPPRALTT